MEERTELLVAADRLEELGFETAAAALRKLADPPQRFYLITQDEWGYDEMIAAVVRASSAENARLLVSRAARDEGPNIWLDPQRTRCDVLPIDGPEEIICRDVREG